MFPQENAKNAMQSAQEVSQASIRASRIIVEVKELAETLQAASQTAQAAQLAALTANQLAQRTSNDAEIKRRVQEVTYAFAEAARRAAQAAIVCEKCIEMEFSSRS
jgi:formylmethanofuran dehydrogenase subunit E